MDEGQHFISSCRPRRVRHHLWLPKRFPFLQSSCPSMLPSTHCAGETGLEREMDTKLSRQRRSSPMKSVIT
jgi:hypothetical protein